ncbi:glycosyltransferase family 4 protein [Streptomyces sp. NPDC001817]|uniref:glycosyltransferase family 4 protein n=1 Tax=Streptomyces sp. NPDC001817 TaxID=3154398 RepID=UPI00332D1B36
MKISFLIHNVYGLGGTNRTTINLASALAERHEVEIVSVFQNTDTPLFAVDPRIRLTSLIDTREVPEVERSAPARVFPAAEARYRQYSTVTDERAAAYFGRNNPDVLIGTRPGLNVYVARFGGDRTLRIGQEHITLASHPEALRPELKKAYARLNGFVTVSEADAANYLSDMAIPGLPIVSIPNSVPAPSVSPADPAAKTVVAAGRLAVIKRYDLLVQAFAKVAAKHPDWRLRIYGDGGQRGKLRSLINDLGLYDQVHLMGLASPIEAEWVKGSIAAVTSDSESFGMTIVEAMRCGVPVVSTDCPLGPREIIRDGEDGLLVRPGDVDSIAEGLLRLIDDDSARAAMGAAARRNAERFDPAAIAVRYEELFRELGAGRSTAAPGRTSLWGRLLRNRAGRAAAPQPPVSPAPAPAPMSGSVHADADGSLRVVLAPTAPVDEGRLLLIRRGGEDRTTLRVPLVRDPGGRLSAPVERTLPLGNAVWDLWIAPAKGPRKRLRSDLLDLRGLMDFRPEPRLSPVRALLPYATVDGFVALSTREADVHAEVQGIDIDGGEIGVTVRLFGTDADAEGVELRHRGRADAPVLEPSWHRGGEGLLHARVGCADVARHHHDEQDLWDLSVRVAGRAEPVRVGGWFGDVKDRKKVYVYPVTVFEETPRGRARVRPYYTVDNDLSVNAVDLP